jgi:hypothetical protein
MWHSENEPLNKFIQRQQNQHAKQLRFYNTTLCEIYKIPVRCALYCPSVSQSATTLLT